MRFETYSDLVFMMPMKFSKTLASSAGVSVAGLSIAVQQQMKAVFSQAELEMFEFDEKNMVVGQSETQRSYALIPTKTVIKYSNNSEETNSTTLAFVEGDRWSLISIDTAPEAELLRELYPDLANIEFPETTVKILDQTR